MNRKTLMTPHDIDLAIEAYGTVTPPDPPPDDGDDTPDDGEKDD